MSEDAEEVIPGSPLALSFQASNRIRRRKILKCRKLAEQTRDQTDEIILVTQKSLNNSASGKHKLLDSSEDENEIIEETEISAFDKSFLHATTPVAKRYKSESEDIFGSPRQLNYESDDLTQRDSPTRCSSYSGSPVFLSLDLVEGEELVSSKLAPMDTQDNEAVFGDQEKSPPETKEAIESSQASSSPERRKRYSFRKVLDQGTSSQVSSSSAKRIKSVPVDEVLGEGTNHLDVPAYSPSKAKESSKVSSSVEKRDQRTSDLDVPVTPQSRSRKDTPGDQPRDQLNESEEITTRESEPKFGMGNNPFSMGDGFKFGNFDGGNFPLGFTTAAGVPIEVPKSNINFWSDDEDEITTTEPEPIRTTPNDVSEENSNTIRPSPIFDPFSDSQYNEDLLVSIANESSQMRIKTTPSNIPPIGFKATNGKDLYNLSAESRRKVELWEKQLDKEAKILQDFYNEEDPQDGLSSEYLEWLNAKERSQRVPKISELPPSCSPATPGPSRGPQMSTPYLKPTQWSLTQEVFSACDAVLQDSEFFQSQLPISPILRKEMIDRRKTRRTMRSNARKSMLLSKITPEMEKKRHELITSLQDAEKPIELRIPFKSEFIAKKLGKGKIPLRKLFPSLSSEGTRLYTRDTFPLANVQFKNLLEYKLNMLEFLSNDEIRHDFENGIKAGHFIVPMTENFEVGLSELMISLSAARGIDPKLITLPWFENAFTLIIWKLVSMELQLPEERQGEFLTVENVLNQLHYRYYMEIDQSKRSILQECLEMDEKPGWPMILVVVDIIKCDELLLSDGQYVVRTKIDECLEIQVAKRTLRRGVKVIVDSAEFLNLDQGYAPLEVPDKVALMIHGNSTRRCRWDARLGRFRGRGRLTVPLRSVNHKGGLISAMQLLVVRKYPPLFVSENRHRSERMQTKYRRELETRNFNLYEKLYHQIDRKLSEEEEEERANWELASFSKISEVTDMEDLFHLMQSTKGRRFDEDLLTKEQKRDLGEYRERKLRERKEKIDQRINETMDKDLNSNNVLLRIKVTDLHEPTLENCAELRIWSPCEEVDRMAVDGAQIYVENLEAKDIRNNILQLKASRKFLIRKVEKMKQEKNFKIDPRLQRNVTKLSEASNLFAFDPVFQEFDVVVIVLNIPGRETDKYEHIFATDTEENVICLNFWNGVKEYAFEDLVRPGQVLAISNLEWRQRFNTFTVPNGYVKELTVITTNPRRSDLVVEMEKCKAFLGEHSLEELTQSVLKKYPVLERGQNESSRLNVSGQSPVVNTPVRGQRAIVTPNRSITMQTPLIERQLNLLKEAIPGSSVFQSPKTPVSTGAGRRGRFKRK